MNGITFIPEGAVISLVAAMIGAPVAAAGLAAILCRYLRRSSAAARHWVWWLALVMMATCFVVAVFQWSVAVPIRTHAAEKIAGRIPPVATSEVAVVETVRSVAFVLFAGFWQFGVLALLLRSAVGILRLRAIIRRSQTLEANVLETVRTGMDRSKLRGVRHLVSAEIAIPMVAGILRPVILLPESALSWPRRLLRAALVHEYAHVERRDLAMLAFARFVTFLYWMNPVSWYALRRMQVEAEMAADDCVVISDGEPVAYAEGLVELIRVSRRGAAFHLPAMGMVRGGGSIEARVARILDGECQRLPPGTLRRWVLMAAAILLTAGLIGVRFVVASPIPVGTQALRGKLDVPVAFQSAPFTLDTPYPAPADEPPQLRAQKLLWYAEGFFLVSVHEPGTDGVRIDLPVGAVLVEVRRVPESSLPHSGPGNRNWFGDFPGPGYREQKGQPVRQLSLPKAGRGTSMNSQNQTTNAKSMKIITHALRLFALGALSLGFGGLLRAEDLDAPKAAAIVNGEVITNLEVTVTMPESDRNSPDARKAALEGKIDRTLMAQAVRKKITKPSTDFAAERVEEIVKSQFHGDRDSFEAALREQGYTVELFKQFQEEQILVQIMKREICGKESNPVARDEQIAAWLAKARAEATIVYK